MAIILETERLALRTWSLADAADGFRIWSDPAVMRYISYGKPQTLERTRQWLGRMIAHQQRYGFCYWAVVEKASHQLLGSCGMAHYLDSGPTIDFGYTLARSHWGRGLASEAAGAALRYAFEKLHLTELVASVDERNAASRRVLEKIGFVFERREQVETGVDFWYVARAARKLNARKLK